MGDDENPRKRPAVQWATPLVEMQLVTWSSTEYDRALPNKVASICSVCEFYISGDVHRCRHCYNYDLCDSCFAMRFKDRGAMDVAVDESVSNDVDDVGDVDDVNDVDDVLQIDAVTNSEQLEEEKEQMSERDDNIISVDSKNTAHAKDRSDAEDNPETWNRDRMELEKLLDKDHQLALLMKRLNTSSCNHTEDNFFTIGPYDFFLD
eukprot:m.104365 g.104365  ORF g.104365 m.104365 type:complete len:206 (-) comp9111_c2_seq5:1654-2271(-)